MTVKPCRGKSDRARARARLVGATKPSLAEAQLAPTDIARLTESFALRGSSYGYAFTSETGTLGHTLCAARN